MQEIQNIFLQSLIMTIISIEIIKLDLQIYYAYYKDIFNLDELEDISGYFSFINVYENFDFYNGIVWHR